MLRRNSAPHYAVRDVLSHLVLQNDELWERDRVKRVVDENQDIGNGCIGNPIYPGPISISEESISGMSIFIAVKWTYRKWTYQKNSDKPIPIKTLKN